MESTRPEKPIPPPPIPASKKFIHRCLSNGSNVHLIDDGHFSSFQLKSAMASSFYASDVPGCVAAGNVSSFSTLKIFRDASRMQWLLFPPQCLLGSFPLAVSKQQDYITDQPRCIKLCVRGEKKRSSGAVWESRWPSWAVRPNEPSGFRGRKAILNHASALVSAWP